MKKYTDYKTALCLGLLGFNTLSSCAQKAADYMEGVSKTDAPNTNLPEGDDKDHASTIEAGSVQNSMVLTDEILKELKSLDSSDSFEEYIKSLFEKGLHPNAQDKDGWTIWMYLVHEFFASAQQRFFKYKMDFTLREFEESLKNHKKLDINIQNNDGNTALMIAASMGETPMINILIENNANPLIKNNRGDHFTTLNIKRLTGHVGEQTYAIQRVFKIIGTYIKSHEMPTKDLNDFIRSIDIAIKEKERDKGKDSIGRYSEELDNFIKSVDAKSDEVRGSIDLTEEILNELRAHNFSEESIQHYLNKSLSIDAQDKNGWTILMHVVDALASNGSDRFTKGSSEELRKSFEILSNKANLNIKNKDGNTAIMLAGIKMDIDLINRLIEKDVYPFERNKEGDNFIAFLIKSNYRDYSVDELKNSIETIFNNIEKREHLKSHKSPDGPYWRNFITNIDKAIKEKYRNDDIEKQFIILLNSFMEKLDKLWKQKFSNYREHNVNITGTTSGYQKFIKI